MRILLPLLAALLLPCTVRAETLVLSTEAYPPFVAQREDGHIYGSGIDLIHHIMAQTGQDYRIEVLPWARALTMAKTRPMACVFAAARNPERDKQFKWIEPLLVIRTNLVTTTGSDVHASTLEEAGHYTVGTHRKDFSEALLREKGFQHIDLAASFEISLGKLLIHRIDLMPMSDETFANLKTAGKPLEKVVLLSEEPLGIACNPEVPDALIAAMQTNLDALRTSGELYRILLEGAENAKPAAKP